MPLSVLNSWKQDAHRFYPSFHIYIHHDQDFNTREASFHSWKSNLNLQKRSQGTIPVHVFMTTYEMAMIDNKMLSHKHLFSDGYMIVDEAHRLKNRASKLFRHLEKISSLGRILLTGTPLQNNLGMNSM